MNIRFWKQNKTQVQEHDSWEIAEKPMIDYNETHRETMEIIEDILIKLDEIKVLIDEMKNEDNKDV